MRRVLVGIIIAVCGLFGVSPAAALALGFQTQTFTGDSDSGISSTLTYTHAVDFRNGSGGPTSSSINGVIFHVGGNGDNLLSLNYNLQNANNSYANTLPNASDQIHLTGAIHSLDKDSFYGGGGPDEILTLSGLHAGTIYQTTFYSVGSGPAGTRYSNVSDGVNQILYDQNSAGKGNGSLLIDVFKATGTTVTFTWTVAPALTFLGNQGDPNSTNPSVAFQQFGFTNAQAVPEPSTFLLLAVGGLSFWFIGHRRSRR